MIIYCDYCNKQIDIAKGYGAGHACTSAVGGGANGFVKIRFPGSFSSKIIISSSCGGSEPCLAGCSTHKKKRSK